MLVRSLRRAASAAARTGARVAAAGALISCSGGVATEPPPSAPSALQDKPIPDFRRDALDGSSVDTKSARGRVVAVKFFAKYCEPCRLTIPEAQALHEREPDVVLIGVDEDEREEDARALVATYGITFPVVHDRGNVLSGRYRVSDMPTTFVADAAGTVRWIGGGTTGALAAAVAAARKAR